MDSSNMDAGKSDKRMPARKAPAAALRDNLRRRKQAERAAPAPVPPVEAGEKPSHPPATELPSPTRPSRP